MTKSAARFRQLLLSIICLGASFSLSAQFYQTECSERYEIAQQLYRAGRLNLVIDTLQSCLDIRDARRLDILSLSAATYKFLDETELAKQQLLKLFDLNPFYQLDRSIPELRYLENELVIYPKREINVKAGVYILNRPIITQKNNLEGIEIVDESFGLNNGDALAVFGEVTYGRSLWPEGPYLNFGVGISNYSFRYSGIYENVLNPNGESDRAEVSFRERHWWVHLPVYLKHYFVLPGSSLRKQIFIPYAYGGFSLDFMRGPSAEWTDATVIYNNYNEGQTLSLDELSIEELRRGFNTSLMLGGGIKARSGVHTFFVELGYAQMLRNLAKDPSNGSDIDDVISQQWHYADNGFQLANISLTIGYSRFFFNAEKRK
ncbi:MAG: hypothetical protein AAF985_15735 [Bacteroidota bacterium]